MYNVALIFNYEDEWFQIAVPHIHSGRSSQISVVDRCRVSNWIDYGSLSSLFCDFETRLNNTWDSFENCVSFLRGLVIHYSAYGIEQFVLVEKSNELEEWICAKWNEYQSDGIFLNDRDLIELSQDEFDEFEVDGIQAVYEQWNVVLSVYGWEIIDDFVEGIIESCYRDGNTKRAEEISTFYSEYKQKAQNTHWGLEDDKSDYYLDNDNPNDRFDHK